MSMSKASSADTCMQVEAVSKVDWCDERKQSAPQCAQHAILLQRRGQLLAPEAVARKAVSVSRTASKETIHMHVMFDLFYILQVGGPQR
jgi:hypothetical protein